MKNFIFDVDGTLIKTYEMYMPAMIDVLAKYGYTYSPEEAERMKHDLFGITGKDALVISQIPEDQHEAILADWFKLSYEREDRTTIFPGVEDTLAKLANRPGTSLAVATSKLGAEYQEHIAAKFAFAKNFKTAVTFDDVKHGKPAPDMIQVALKRLGNTDLSEAVYVGDTVNDLLAAHAAGIKFAAALYGSGDKAKLADADFMLTSPEQLLDL